ncbi:MAG: DegV family protein [Atopobiaceae bacterium]|nr:DegV family protein [Atopobiaceae bacterium]MDD3176176.1 DegV family protein [Atopobiaceae bacterium]MDD3486271.1 DegV family protein [Atopobiaceae bacterium]MDD4380355.1 DegV family protein [Atopobiaceae bacterium]
MSSPHDFEIVTDSTCDIPLAELDGMGVAMVPLTVFVGERALLDEVEVKPEEFYDLMAASPELPHSSQPSPDMFGKAYADLEASGARRILVLTISQALSGTYNSASLAAEGSSADVRVVDTHLASMGHGMALKEAVRMRDAGESLEATIDHVRSFSAGLSSLFVPDTLDNLVKNGRCTKLAGFATSLFDIKVNLTLDDAGAIIPIHKARGARGAYQWIAHRLVRLMGEGAHVVVTFIQVRNRAGADQLLGAMRSAGLEVDVQGTYDCGPVIATHTGVGLVSVGVVAAAAVYHANVKEDAGETSPAGGE